MSEELNKAFINGMGCGAKTFCQVIKDKITEYKGNDTDELVKDILKFVNVTLETSPPELQKVLEKIQTRVDSYINNKNT